MSDYASVPGQSATRRALRALRIGRIAYLAWHAPLAMLRQSAREGGPWEQWMTRRGRMQMVCAARRLPSLAPPAAGAPEFNFLTGRKFWHQTAFCAWSLQRSAGCDPSYVFHDDGSFDGALVAEARRIFPNCAIVTAAESEARLDIHLPASRFPTLRGLRKNFMLLRKLTDIHAGRTGWRVFLDSDMLFFRHPDALLAWVAAPDRPVHMLDVHNAYGYPAAVFPQATGRAPADLVNTGIFGLRSDALNWDQIEAWAAALLSSQGTSYYLEQALAALIVSGQPALRLSSFDYRLMPGDAECRQPTAALHHYVDLSKRGYFRYAWRHFE